MALADIAKSILETVEAAPGTERAIVQDVLVAAQEIKLAIALVTVLGKISVTMDG